MGFLHRLPIAALLVTSALAFAYDTSAPEVVIAGISKNIVTLSLGEEPPLLPKRSGVCLWNGKKPTACGFVLESNSVEMRIRLTHGKNPFELGARAFLREDSRFTRGASEARQVASETSMTFQEKRGAPGLFYIPLGIAVHTGDKNFYSYYLGAMFHTGGGFTLGARGMFTKYADYQAYGGLLMAEWYLHDTFNGPFLTLGAGGLWISGKTAIEEAKVFSAAGLLEVGYRVRFAERFSASIAGGAFYTDKTRTDRLQFNVKKFAPALFLDTSLVF